MERSITELPSLKQFRAFCLCCAGAAILAFLLVSAITFAPSALWLGARAALLTGIVAFYFLIIGGRTHVMIHQLSRNRPQTFDRPAPEWITVPFMLATIAIVLWPHLQ